MRIHGLSLSAFGPFAGTVDVDVDDVARDGLFLLWGPTGAGKTTLLDAVVFALYGTVPGVRGHDKRLRSDHADAAVRTEVTCELTLSGERLRVVRRPEQNRPKKRGPGETTEPARLVVSRWEGDTWAPVSTRIDEGSEYLATRLGLTAEQFCQVVLLPQGEFARFLRAEPEDRARLLATLFDVRRFAVAEEWLTAERRAAEEGLRGERARTSTLLARVAQVADEAVPEELAPELVGAAPRGPVARWVSAVRARAADQLAGSARTADEAAARLGDVAADLAAARALTDRHTRRDRARADLRRLEGQEAAVAPFRERLAAARRAETLRDILERSRTAGEAVVQAAAAADRAGIAWARVAAGREATGDTARLLRDEAAELRGLLPEAEELSRLAAEVAALDEQLEALAARCDDGERRSADWPDRLAALQLEAERAADAAARLPALGTAARATAAALAAARAGQALDGRRAGLAERHRAAREALLTAREALVELRGRRLDGMAAELAARLVDGLPCPVCGGIEHPRPASAAVRPVSADDEEAARALVEAAEAVSTRAAEAVEGAEREAAVLAERAGRRQPEVLAAELADQEAVVGTTGQLAAGLVPTRERLSAAERERDALLAGLARDREARSAARADRAARSDRVDQLRTRLDLARGTDPDLPSRVRRLLDEAERCETLVRATADQTAARTAAAGAAQEAERRCTAAGFAGVAAAAAALVDEAERASLEQRITRHDTDRAAVARVLAEPELAALGTPPDLPAAEEAVALATARRDESVTGLDRARRRVQALDDLAGEVLGAEVELDRRREEAARVGGLADVVAGRGANDKRMRLQSFVLAARLEQVAEVASSRLRTMSGGRYTFVHSDAQARHGARGGLGLDVLDEYTGQRRPTKTLSGGESFMASLALALGLADVVTAESGGVSIDTLFIDEGFGTLDARSLDAVLEVLDDLRRGGRTVGVISHVEEVRTRIPARLEVLTDRTGSRLSA